MALIKCNECGKDISDQATTCPNCGYPIKKVQQSTQNIQRQTVQQKQSKTTMGVASMVLGILAILNLFCCIIIDNTMMVLIFSVISLPLRHFCFKTKSICGNECSRHMFIKYIINIWLASCLLYYCE